MVAWRFVNALRERVERFSVLVPQDAFSAATLLALGADEIVMHPYGCLGPVDVTVAILGMTYKPLFLGDRLGGLLPLRASVRLPSESLLTR